MAGRAQPGHPVAPKRSATKPAWKGSVALRAGMTALRAVAGRQAKELDQDEIKERLARIAGREQGADEIDHEVGANAIRDRLSRALGREGPGEPQKQQREPEEERKRQRQLELERQRELDRDSGWEL